MTISEWYKPEVNVLVEDLKKEYLPITSEKNHFKHYYHEKKESEIIEKVEFQKNPIDYLERFSKIFSEDKKNIIQEYGNCSYKSKVETIDGIYRSIMQRDDYIKYFVEWIRSHPKNFVKEAFPSTDDAIIKPIQMIYEKIIASETFERDLTIFRDCIVGTAKLPKVKTPVKHLTGNIITGGGFVRDYTSLGLFQYNSKNFDLRKVQNIAPHFALATVYDVVNRNFTVLTLTESCLNHKEKNFDDFLASDLKYDD